MNIKTIVLGLTFFCASTARGQFLMDMVDTSKSLGKGMLGIYERFGQIRFTGYMQPQYQFASSEGAGGNIYAGGAFPQYSDNRFRLRRGRIRIDYMTFTEKNQPQLQFVFQFDGTEQGVNIRDFWGRIWENKWQKFSFTTGMFARPFGWEINLSSSDRETPERGRMSQILMKTERDLGFMTSFEDRKKNVSGLGKYIRFDVGVFNGQGLSGPVEFDSYKDFIGQVVLKKVKLGNNISLTGGVSILEGKLRQNNKYRYVEGRLANGTPAMVKDSSNEIGSGAPRQYRGVNAQLRWKHGWGETQLRSEYWWGKQSAQELASETPPTNTNDPLYVRRFDGAFFYIIQDIVNSKNQLLLKYDWYDPNKMVSGTQIGVPGTKLSGADMKYDTWGFGLLHHFNEHLKMTFYYDLVRNEHTAMEGAKDDISDDILTCRLQFRF